MSRNSISHFSMAPQVDISRSRFHRNSNLKTSFNVGDLVPIYLDEVLPGDTWSIKTSKVLRLQTLLDPVMENLNFDIYYFFVPNRIIWDHWEEFMGANKTGPWIPQVEYSIPQILAPEIGWKVGTVADYMGVPLEKNNEYLDWSINALPFRAYAKICEDWFRDESTQDPVMVYTGDSDVQGANAADDFINGPYLGGQVFRANKYHDFFTSCLPSPQRGPSVLLPLGNSAPVKTVKGNPVYEDGDIAEIMTFGVTNSTDYKFDSTPAGVNNLQVYTSGNLMGYSNGLSGSTGEYPVPNNLYADLTNATNTTINELRMAFQIQRLYERDARAGGGRYVEQLRAHFGVTSPDGRLQRSEYLGGNRFPFNVQQVAQTSTTSGSSTPQGNLAGFSVTADVHHDFTKSFTEHGYIIGVACARYEHSYQENLDRLWSRTERFHFYYPALANIGEQAVKNKEIFFAGNSDDDEVFGYQEAWAEYRYKPNKITGQMRSVDDGALDSWHFADKYLTTPALSAAWMREDKSNVDRALAVNSTLANQIFGDIYFECSVTRPMPLYSVPGLIDHL